MGKCDICQKTLSFGNKVSHSNRKSKRQFSPNLHKVKVRGKKIKICSRCIKKMEYLKI